MINQYDEIFTWHPQLVLISTKPVKWRGFLKINNNRQIEIKLKVPNYPEMKDAKIHFRNDIHHIHGSDFSIKLTNLLNNATSVLPFLNQLQRTIDEILKSKTNYDDNLNDNFNCKILDDLKNTLIIPGIIVFIEKELKAIKLIYKNKSIQIKHNSIGNNSWTLVSSDLPQLRGWKPLENYLSSLNEAADTLKSRVNILDRTWQHLKTIDENCWIVDPINPKPYHLYRRIHLNSALSLLITLDPLDPESLQEIKILGSDNEVLKCQNTINKNLSKWSYNKPMIENLLDLLNVSELPQPPAIKDNKINANAGIVSDEECCICFSLDLDDGVMPSEICNNDKCQRVFHTSCLFQWLTAVVGNQVVFDRIHGNCPNCNENISCRIINIE